MLFHRKPKRKAARRATREEVQAAWLGVLAGDTVSHRARMLGVNDQALRRALLKQTPYTVGWSLDRLRTARLEERRELFIVAKNLWERGFTEAEIGAITNTSQSKISNLFIDAGWQRINRVRQGEPLPLLPARIRPADEIDWYLAMALLHQVGYRMQEIGDCYGYTQGYISDIFTRYQNRRRNVQGKFACDR